MSGKAAVNTPSDEPAKGTNAEAAKSPSVSPASRFYRQELDWLRFCAFFAVFCHHCLPLSADVYQSHGMPRWLSEYLVAAVGGGAYGVDLFFVLSSYLITELLLRENRARGGIDVRAFYIRRILRIWPLYYLFVLFAAFVVPLISQNDRLPTPYILGFLLFSGNWICATRGYPPSVANPLWSVSIEEQFYIAWPLILSRLKVAAIWYLAPAMIVVATITRVFLARAHVPHPGIWCNTLARLDPIATGAILALVADRITSHLNLPRRALLLLAGLLIALVMSRLNTFLGYRSLFGYPMVSLGSALLLLSFLGLKARPCLAASALAYLGRISYGLYVFHVLAIKLVHKFHLPFMLHFSLSLLACIAIAWASYRWLESPFLRLKARFTYVPSGAAAASRR
jgi:peptidoglycan/LPS O-acetylase OafA/YrhL